MGTYLGTFSTSMYPLKFRTFLGIFNTNMLLYVPFTIMGTYLGIFYINIYLFQKWAQNRVYFILIYTYYGNGYKKGIFYTDMYL